MRRRFCAWTSIALLAFAPACSGVGGAVIIRADGGAPGAATPSRGSDASTSTSGSSSGSGSGGESSGGSGSSSGGAALDASSVRDAGPAPGSGGSQDSGGGSPPPQEAGTMVCPNDPVHGEEAVTAIATGHAV